MDGISKDNEENEITDIVSERNKTPEQKAQEATDADKCEIKASGQNQKSQKVFHNIFVAILVIMLLLPIICVATPLICQASRGDMCWAGGGLVLIFVIPVEILLMILATVFGIAGSGYQKNKK